jgi:hypothetical protein
MSKTKLRSTQFSINELIKQVQGYSYASKADMKHMLIRCIKDLHELGFKLAHIKGLKPKHVHVLVAHWKQQGKNTATIKNYMSKLRKTALILEKPKLVKPKNDDYQIEKRRYAPNHNKAIHNVDFSKCTDSHIKLSLEAQALFGLRREESMKIVLSEAWKENHLLIKASWAKGGISRVIEITNNEQRDWLKKTSQKIILGQSLIPQDRTYKQHLSHYQLQTKQMGLKKCHGLRYAYAQRRYHELTKALDPRKKGFLCPRAGGKNFKDLNNFEKSLDRRARTILSRNLGHSRLEITRIYCG